MPPVSISSKATPFHSQREPLAVAGDARLGVGDRLAAAGEAVDEGALADVGEADDGDRAAAARLAHARPLSRASPTTRSTTSLSASPVVSSSTASGGRPQRAVLALAVAAVAPALGGEHPPRVLAALGGPAPGALLVGGGEEDLQRRLGADDGADVAALGDVAPGGDQLALAGDHRLAHLRVDRDPRGGGR